MRRRLPAAALIIAAVLLTACSSSPSQTNGSGGSSSAGQSSAKAPYRLGAVMALTGAYAGTDKDAYAALQATVAQINAEGGVNGHQLEYKVQDDQSNPNTAALAAQELIQNYKPNFMFPDTLCVVTLAAMTPIKNAGISSFTGCDPGKGGPSDPTAFPYSFSTDPPNAPNQITAMWAAVQEVMGSTPIKLGVIYTDDASGALFSSSLDTLATSHGATWAGGESFAVGAPDMTVQLSKLKDAGANIVVQFGQIGDGNTALKDLDQLGWNPKVIGNQSVLTGSMLGSVPASMVANFQAMLPAAAVRPVAAGSVAAQFAPYLAKYSTNINTYAVVIATHDALMLWKWAVDKSGSVSPQAVTAQLEKLSSLPASDLPGDLLGTPNPDYSSTVHGEIGADLVNGWGLGTISQDQEGTFAGKLFTCEACH
jgi:branched-chain amino acid transport system substrate-binding protein